MIYIYAPNVRSYGGITLIQSIVDLDDSKMVFVLNENLKLRRNPKNVILSSGGLLAQYLLELKLKKELSSNDVMYCMTNKPPFVKLPCFVITSLLSVFAIEIPKDVPISASRRVKSNIQIGFNKFLKKNTDIFMARSESMVSTCISKTNTRTEYFPYSVSKKKLVRSHNPDRPLLKRAVFFYPSDDAPHKNLINVFVAWQILFSKNIDAKLVTTIKPSRASEIDNQFSEHGIEAVGYLTENELTKQYKSCDALIFPSLLESFPLPILEAREHNLPILASERDFIREQIDPEETFDPHSALSIARAVQRFMGVYNCTHENPHISELPDFIRSVSVDI